MTVTTADATAPITPPARVPWRRRLYTWVLGGVLGALAPGFAASLEPLGTSHRAPVPLDGVTAP